MSGTDPWGHRITLSVGAAAAAGALVLYGIYSEKRARRRHGGGARRACSASAAFGSSITLEWSEISVELKKPKEKAATVILNRASGAVTPGTLTAILGPSGSGKTTLLSVLAGKLKRSRYLKATGQLKVNGAPLLAGETFEHGYVMQDDVFFSHLTVRETLQNAQDMRALRQTDANVEKADDVTQLGNLLASRVDNLLALMNLTTAQHTIIGTLRERGISGGEKKRLSIALQLISDPPIIFLDEPTTGLDAFQAKAIMKLLRDLANRGRTVVVTLHQPREQIHELLDTVVLLAAHGRTVYSGAGRDTVAAHFASCGHPIPAQCNPPDHFLDLVSLDASSDAHIRQSTDRIDDLICAFRISSLEEKAKSKPVAIPRVDDRGSIDGAPARQAMPWAQQLRVLFKRNFTQLVRDRKTLFARFASTLGTSTCFGLIYFRLGSDHTQSSIISRQGLLQVLVNYTAMTSLVKTINAFGKERVIVERELSDGVYDFTPYLLSKICSELPMAAFFPFLCSSVVYPLAGLQLTTSKFATCSMLIVLQSLVSSSLGLVFGAGLPLEAALEGGKATMMMSIIFGGFYFSDQTLPRYMRWLCDMSLVKHGFRALVANEMCGLSFEGAPFSTGEAVLAHIGVSTDAVSIGLRRCLSVVAVNYAATYAALLHSQPRFVDLAAPDLAAPEGSSGLRITFKAFHGVEKDVVFTHRPLGLDFEKVAPIVIEKVCTGSCAEDCGIQPGWTITGVNGLSVVDSDFEVVCTLLKKESVQLPLWIPNL